ncbi:16S rRNA (guanine(527)-N(7))-methyltransferase RsmG [Bifidobacterium leontopitheci]|uniref:16S rRNA (guanine(527)-N(7))-methyltransferase RsmG n=1 Tax=Bifidobacterium leontopitheci TaxID=2650774 RepID=UPI001D00CE02|nr:16S rRNA (guanine(527)-N(7))-methyltransferase RsmG [Bifidobacterium leontopitheci]
MAADDADVKVAAATEAEPVADELDGNPVVRDVLGDAYDKLAMFHVKLSREGEPRGLIGPRDVSILWERHILNSAACVPYIREALGGKSRGRVADVGSGGGFPGIVAATCLPDVSFTLIEPMERRVAWLEECVDEMGLDNVEIIRARSDEVIDAIRKHVRGVRPFDVVTCRAVAPMTKLSGWTLPLLKPHGRLVAIKGRSAQAEIEKAKQQITRAKGQHPRVVEAEVAPGLEPTHVVLVDKR